MTAQHELPSLRAAEWRRLLPLLAFVCVATLAPAATAPLVPGPRPEPGAPDDRARLAELRAEIARHDELYFRESAPEITDSEYDALKRELRALERQLGPAASPEPAPGGARPSTIGDDRTGRHPTARHIVPMSGLAKVRTEEELRAFHRRMLAVADGPMTFVVEPKYDGVAISLTYERGMLVRVATRGDGREGDDVTAAARHVRNLPPKLRTAAPGGGALPAPDRVELRGEIFLGKSAFARLNRERAGEGEPPFAHPRSVAAGSLKADDAELAGRRGLELVVFGLGDWEGAAPPPGSHQELREVCRNWGLAVTEFCVAVDDAVELVRTVVEFGRARATWAFPSDGVVVKVDSRALQRRVGEGAEGPAWTVAYKFPPEQAVTRLRGVVIQVGRTGVLTPVAEFEPVELGGAVVSRANLHNAAELRRRDLRHGDWVRIERAGDIIPVLTGVELGRRAPAAEPYEFPPVCPSCGGELAEEAPTGVIRCPNRDCPAQVRRRLEHFVSSAGVGLAGLGPAGIERLVTAGRVRTPADLYALDAAAVRAAGWEAPSAERILAAIASSRSAPLERVIAGVGIPGVGPAAARALARRFPDLAALAAARRADLVAEGASRVPGLGRSAAEAVAEWLALPGHAGLLRALHDAGVGRAGRPDLTGAIGESQ